MHADLIAAARREILLCPGDDFPRLQLADMLMDSEDERDRLEGEFVAKSVAFHSRQDPPCFLYGRSRRGVCGACDWCEAWFSVAESRPALDEAAKMLLGPHEALDPPSVFGYWRGLPHTWAVAGGRTFEREAKDVFAKWPIVRVVLRQRVNSVLVDATDGDLTPRVGTPPSACRLPTRLFALLECGDFYSGDDETCPLRNYHDPDLARADLERAYVVHGRRLAGLPDLEGAR